MADDAEAEHAAGGHTEPAGDLPAKDLVEQPESTTAHQETELGKRDTLRWVGKRWRLFMFVFILVLAMFVGFYFKSQADPGMETLEHSKNPPQVVNVYVSNPRISVEVELDINSTAASPDRYVFADLSVGVRDLASHPRGRVLITSSLRPSFLSASPPDSAYAMFSHGRQAAVHDQYYYTELILSHTRDSGGKQGSLTTFNLGEFRIPDVLQESKGLTFGHLPSVGGLSGDEVVAEMAKGGHVRDISYKPTFEGSGISEIRNGRTVSKSGPTHMIPHGILFYVPAKSSVTEYLIDILPVLRDAQTIYMSPPAKISQDSYMWRAEGNLQPTFQTVESGAADREGEASFTSGISFGVAGAALIALFQELPKEFPRPGKPIPWVRSLRLGSWARKIRAKLKQGSLLKRKLAVPWKGRSSDSQ